MKSLSNCYISSSFITLFSLGLAEVICILNYFNLNEGKFSSSSWSSESRSSSLFFMAGEDLIYFMSSFRREFEPYFLVKLTKSN